MLDTDGRYILSPKDLCTVDFLDQFINAGVRVLKIEGRARGGEYVKRVVEAYDKALRLIEAGEYTRESAAELKESLLRVFNRGFWGGYYANKLIVEHTNAYGSSATHRKEYVGKVTNFFKNISVAEITVESSDMNEGDDILIMGETTGVVEQKAHGIVLDNKVVEGVKKGDVCSIKTSEIVRRGDKLYKEVLR